MPLVVDIVGRITLPDGTECYGVILVADTKEETKEAAKLWAEKVQVVSVPKAKRRSNVDDCVTCERERAAGNSFHPPHDASPICHSGGKSHCSCGTCF